MRKESLPPVEVRERLRDELLSSIDTLTIAEAVKAMRLALGKTQEEYARMAGVTRRTLSLIENDLFNPSLDVLEGIARPFGLEVGFRIPASRRGRPA